MRPEDVVYIDFEASGLHERSYPIEIGWASPVADLPGGSVLIKPLDSWGEADWSPEAEGVHGIARWETVLTGRDAPALAAELNERFAGKVVASDHPGMDGQWMDRLFDDAGLTRRFWIRDVLDVLEDVARAIADPEVATVTAADAYRACWTLYGADHRALPDARRWARLHRAMAEPQVLAELRSRAAAVPKRIDDADAAHFAGLVTFRLHPQAA